MLNWLTIISILVGSLLGIFAYEYYYHIPLGKAKLSYNAGVSYYKERNFKKAVEWFQKTLNMTNNAKIKRDAHYNLGNALVVLELPTRAKNSYIEALKIDPDFWEAKYNLERLYAFYPMAFPDEDAQSSLDSADLHEQEGKSQMGRSTPGQPDM